MVENENIKKILYMGVGRSGLENESSIIAKALSELMEYRAIGTIEKVKALKEKNEPKKVIRLSDNEYYDYRCPVCGVADKDCMGRKHCMNCGQSLET